jgi:hypothetical protein
MFLQSHKNRHAPPVVLDKWPGYTGGEFPGWLLADGRLVMRPYYIPVEWMGRISPEVDADGKVHLLWTGWNNGKGHAKFSRGGKPAYCYRDIIERVDGMLLRRFDYVDHLCKRKACLTYECFEVVSPKVNTERGPGMGFWFKPKEASNAA